MHWRRKCKPTPVFLLENPRDGGAWWAAVYGVTQSQTQLKRLSSSSSTCVSPQSLQSCLTLCDPMDCSLQAPLPLGFSRQEYWSGLPSPPPGDLRTQGSNPGLLQLLHCRWIIYHWATWEAQWWVGWGSNPGIQALNHYPVSWKWKSEM